MSGHAPAHHAGHAVGRGPAPLALVLALTFLGSVGTGAVTNGIFFITSSALGYGRTANLWLGAAFGLSYVAASLLAGPGLRRLAARSDRLSTRRVLVGLLLVMGLVCQAPLAARAAQGPVEAAVWAMLIVYAPATGVLWPIVESYLSGGRRGKRLRSAVGRFNIVWSGALVVAFWAMSPLLKERPFWILAGLGGLHLAMTGLALRLPPEPARHAEDDEPHPPAYERLLTLFRVLLFASYLILSAVNPLQPIILDRLGVVTAWKMPIASVLLAARVAVFALFERWHGWHGRWWTPWTGLAVMVTGFGLAVGSPAFGGLGLWAYAAGLGLMGVGIATVYCGALYYALAVGSAGVDAGGKHEAVIGVGYTLGPMVGLAAAGLASPAGGPTAGTEADPELFRVWTIALVSACAAAAGAMGWWASRPRRR